MVRVDAGGQGVDVGGCTGQGVHAIQNAGDSALAVRNVTVARRSAAQ
jgi:hypothetical protein